jgi:hypothetical protein
MEAVDMGYCKIHVKMNLLLGIGVAHGSIARATILPFTAISIRAPV